MYFAYIKLTNIGPFRDFEARCGQTMIVTADNGGGKTTFVEAITGLLDDHNSDLITTGEEAGEAYFEFSNGLTVRQTITREGSKYDIRKPSGEKVVRRHKEYLKGLVTGIALDPLKLLTCQKEDRIEYLLRVLPISFDQAEVAQITGKDPGESLSLEQFDNLLAAKEADRSSQNKLVEVSKGHLTRLERSIPAYEADGKDWTAESQRLQTERDAIISERDQLERSKESHLAQQRRQIESEAKVRLEEERLEYERRCAEINRVKDEILSNLEREKDAEIERARILSQPRLDELNANLAVARDRAKNQSEVEALRKSVEQTRAQFREESQEATRRQRVVESMRELRRKKLEALPVPGIEIKNRELYVDGKIFDSQTNTAEKIKVAFQLAHLGANPEYPIMIADAGDFLNERNLEWIVDAARDSGFQLFITKRVEGQKEARVVPYEQYLEAVA
jgi:energy-coupling factor transporter ATP-binding protein EcfA2